MLLSVTWVHRVWPFSVCIAAVRTELWEQLNVRRRQWEKERFILFYFIEGLYLQPSQPHKVTHLRALKRKKKEEGEVEEEEGDTLFMKEVHEEEEMEEDNRNS